MKLTHTLLNNQNYIVAIEKRERLLRFYYSIHKPHQAETLGMAAISMGVIIIILGIINMWIGKTYGEFYFLFSLPISFYLSFYLIFKLWFIFRYNYVKDKYFVIFNFGLDLQGLEELYKISDPNYFIEQYFLKIPTNNDENILGKLNFIKLKEE